MRKRPTARQLAVASFILDMDRGARTEQLLMCDEDIVFTTEYSIRSVKKGWQELVEDGAVRSCRSRKGIRTVEVVWDHPFFAVAEILEVTEP